MKKTLIAAFALLNSHAFSVVLPDNGGQLTLKCQDGVDQVIAPSFTANELVSEGMNSLVLKGVATQGRLGPERRAFTAAEVTFTNEGLRIRGVAATARFTTGQAAALNVLLPGVDANSAQGKVRATLLYLPETRRVIQRVGTPFHWDCDYVIRKP